MVPEYWFAADNVSAAYAKALDAVKALDVAKSMDALTSLNHIEKTLLSPGAHIVLDQHRSIDHLTRALRLDSIDLESAAGLSKLTLPEVAADLATFAHLAHGGELHSHFAQATKVLECASKWSEIGR